ncbi:MAG: ATP-binding protein [Bacteroidales bacterium]|nr:ATP-binding protein [Bacteroidales bacterium]
MIRFDEARYPIGIQDFRDLRKGGYLYVDKTELIARLIWRGKYIFLSRPRRFGKSLLLSTIEYYFKGEKALFEGTWIGKHEDEWTAYPVLHFDMSRSEGFAASQIRAHLNNRLKSYEEKYDIPYQNSVEDLGDRFSSLIESIYKKTGLPVVILIDEYDNGILETLDAPKSEQDAMSDVLRAFYKQPKAMDRYVKFCMVTGVSRFSSYTLFSGPNNYSDISLDSKFAAICGITQEELLTVFGEGVESLSNNLKLTPEETIETLRLKYDSYHFTESEELVYNPFSLLNVFAERRLANYWIKSGTSKVFVKYLTRSEFDLLELQRIWVKSERMEGKYTKEDSIPLLFQTGYLTIKEVKDNLYRLGIPNGEVRSALVDQLMPMYLGVSEDVFPEMLSKFQRLVKDGDVSGWIAQMQMMMAKIPYRLFGPTKSNHEDEEARSEAKKQSIARFERTYHLIVDLFFQMLSINAHSEIEIAGGRIDMVVETDNFVYVIEFKLDGTTSEALNQIESKGYLIPWKADDRKVYKIGIVFSSQTRNISSYEYTPKP